MFGASVTKVMTSQNGKINVWGTGEESRDLLYIQDLVEFVDAAINNQESPYELFNVGIGKPVTVKEVIKKIKEWLSANVDNKDLEWNLRVDSRNLLEYINKWENE